MWLIPAVIVAGAATLGVWYLVNRKKSPLATPTKPLEPSLPVTRPAQEDAKQVLKSFMIYPDGASGVTSFQSDYNLVAKHKDKMSAQLASIDYPELSSVAPVLQHGRLDAETLEAIALASGIPSVVDDEGVEFHYDKIWPSLAVIARAHDDPRLKVV